MVIYATINLVNGKKYIGLDRNNDQKYLGSGKALLRAIKKYGKENFLKRIIETCGSEKELVSREIYWIEHYDAVKSRDFYNMRPGGFGGDCPQFHTKDFINKMTKINSGKNNGMFGKTHTEEAIEKQKSKAKGRWTLEWFIEQYGESDGQKLYEHRNKKLSADRRGEKNPFFGKAHEYEKHPMYRDIPKEEILEYVKQGMTLQQIGDQFGVSNNCIKSKIQRFWNCSIVELR